MPIEITGLSGSQLSGTNEGSKTRPSHTNKSTTDSDDSAPPSPPVDRVSITETAAQLQLMEREIANVPEVDVKRVEDLRLRISNDDYQTDPSRLADKIVNLEAQL